MVHIFEHLVSGSSMGTLDFRDNVFTDSLTADQKQIASGKGYTLNI